MGDPADASRGLQCNSRLAKDLVNVQHRPYRLDIRDNEQVFVVDSGQPVTWGTQLIAHGKDVVYYQWHLDGVVAKVDRITTQLPAGVRVRIEVVVRHPVAVEVGDEILGDGVRLGYVAAFVDDGATAPRVSFDGYHPTTGHQMTVGSRARAVMSARAVGPYDRCTHAPSTARWGARTRRAARLADGRRCQRDLQRARCVQDGRSRHRVCAHERHVEPGPDCRRLVRRYTEGGRHEAAARDEEHLRGRRAGTQAWDRSDPTTLAVWSRGWTHARTKRPRVGCCARRSGRPLVVVWGGREGPVLAGPVWTDTRPQMRVRQGGLAGQADRATQSCLRGLWCRAHRLLGPQRTYGAHSTATTAVVTPPRHDVDGGAGLTPGTTCRQSATDQLRRTPSCSRATRISIKCSLSHSMLSWRRSHRRAAPTTRAMRGSWWAATAGRTFISSARWSSRLPSESASSSQARRRRCSSPIRPS